MLRFIAIYFVFTLISTSALAKPVLKVALDAWPPFRIIDEDKVSGIDHQLWLQLSKQLGFKVQYVSCPWKRCLKMMENGQVDAMSGLAWRKERAKYINYSDSYYQCATRFYVNKGDEQRITSHKDLTPLMIGIVRGSAYYQQFDEDNSLQRHAAAQEAVLPELLIKHRIDTFIGTDCQADYELKLRGLFPIIGKADFQPGNEVKLYVGLSKASSWSTQRARFDLAMEQLRQQQFSQQMKRQYFQ